MHIGSSAVLFATALLQAVCGSAVAETAEESSGRSLVRGGGGRMGDGGDARTMMSGSSFLQQAYRIQELQAEFHSQYSLFRFNIADMQRASIAWCPITIVQPDSGWHACLIYMNSPQYIERDQLIIYNATWRPDDVANGPVTFPLQVVSDSRNEQYKAVGDVTVQCRNKRCRATPEQEEQNILYWEGRIRSAT